MIDTARNEANRFPDNWILISIEDLTLKISNGFTCKQSKEKIGIAVTRIETIANGIVNLKKVGYIENISESEIEKRRLLIGDVLFSHINSDSHLGKTALFSISNTTLLHGMNLLLLRPNSELIRAPILHYWLTYLRFNGYFQSIAQHAVNQSSINISKLKSVELPTPPLREQTRIVEKLEELLSDLDAGVAELKAAQKKLLQYRQSLLKAAVEGALTAEWRKTHQPEESGAQFLERILKQRRANWEAKQLAKFQQQDKTPPKGWQDKYPEPVKPDTSDLPELPEGWAWASAEQICDFITKGTTPTKGMDGDSEKTIPFLRVTNLTANGTLDMSDKVFVSENSHSGFLARSKVYPGDVLMNIVGPPLGQVSVVPSLFSEWNINQAIAIFRALEGVLPEFICVCLLSPIAQHWLQHRSKTTAGQTNLTLEVCRSLPIPLPPKSEQHELVKLTDAGVGSIYEQINAIQISLKQSAAQRKNILKAAFSGQIVPQDPSDEPASVLLERIRAERHMQTVTKKSLNGKRKGLA